MDTARRALILAGISCFATLQVSRGANPVATTDAPGLSWQLVAQSLAGGAFGYLGQRYMSQFFGGSTDLTNEQVVAAIREATEEIKQYVSEDIRKALTEERLKELLASCDALTRNLSQYASISPGKLKSGQYLLNNADIESSKGISLCDQYSPVVLPVYANFVSLRIYVKRAQFLINADKQRYRAFAKELYQLAVQQMTRISDYARSLSPDQRLGAMSCSVESHGGGFPTRVLTCSFTVDGKTTPENTHSEFTQGSGGDAAVQARFEPVRQQRAKELASFKEKVDKDVLQPLRDAAAVWVRSARKIDPSGKFPDTGAVSAPTPPPTGATTLWVPPPPLAHTN